MTTNLYVLSYFVVLFVCNKNHYYDMENTSFSVFKTILIYTTFILAAPITTFFISKFYFFEGIIGASDIASNVWSAVFAVIMLHIAVGLYIYKAYYEAEKVKPLEKKD